LTSSRSEREKNPFMAKSIMTDGKAKERRFHNTETKKRVPRIMTDSKVKMRRFYKAEKREYMLESNPIHKTR